MTNDTNWREERDDELFPVCNEDRAGETYTDEYGQTLHLHPRRGPRVVVEEHDGGGALMKYLCHNPLCEQRVTRGNAYVRSISLEQVIFCSKACVEVFDQLDAETGHRRPYIPEQRQPVDQVARIRA